MRKLSLEDEQVRTDRERSSENEKNRDRSLNRHLSNSRQLRCREVSRMLSRKVSRNWPSTAEGVEEVSRYQTAEPIPEARSIDVVSRRYRGDRENLDRSTRCRGSVEIAIRKRLEKLDS